MKFYSLFGIVSLFPLWALRSNLDFLYIISILIIFFFIPLIIHLKISKLYSPNFDFPFKIWIALLFVYSIDQNIGLWTTSSKIIAIINISNYVKSLIFLIIFLIISLVLILVLKKNGIKIFFSITLTVFFLNILDTNRNFSNFPDINTENIFEIKKKIQNQKLILILDEMSGINSKDSDHISGKRAKQNLLELFKKNNFNIYTNIFSVYHNTKRSVPSTLNFITTENQYKKLNKKNRYLYLEKSNNYFQSFNLTKNSFFDRNYIEKIIVYQSMYLNYCNHSKVFKCYQFNPFDKNIEFLNGFRAGFLTKTFSAYKNNASASSNIIWRLLRHIDIIDSVLEPDGQKASFKHILNKISKSVENKNADLIFAHILVPHVPYAFNNKCEYEGIRGTNYNSINIDQKREQHNLERICVAFYLDYFFNLLKKKKLFDDLEITIFSDHDSRITTDELGSSVIFFKKNKNSNSFKVISELSTSNDIFKKNFYITNN